MIQQNIYINTTIIGRNKEGGFPKDQIVLTIVTEYLDTLTEWSSKILKNKSIGAILQGNKYSTRSVS